LTDAPARWALNAEAIRVGDDLKDQMETSQGVGGPAVSNGSAWAALLAASMGGLGFAIATDISECSARAAKALLWYRPAGSLSGVAGAAIVTWIVTWGALYLLWRKRRLASQGLLLGVTITIGLLALVATFPPLYGLFGG
jgi:hypothetical protein